MRYIKFEIFIDPKFCIIGKNIIFQIKSLDCC